MVYLEMLGLAAGFFSMVAYVPQVYKTWRTKSAKSVSMLMFLICTMGNALWIIYGLALNKPAIYITNIVIFILASFQIILKIKYDTQNKDSQK